MANQIVELFPTHDYGIRYPTANRSWVLKTAVCGLKRYCDMGSTDCAYECAKERPIATLPDLNKGDIEL